MIFKVLLEESQICLEYRGLTLFLKFIELGLNLNIHKSKACPSPPSETYGLCSAGTRFVFFDFQHRALSTTSRFCFCFSIDTKASNFGFQV